MKLGVLCVGFPNFRYDAAQQITERAQQLLRGMPGVELAGGPRVLIDEQEIQKEIRALAAQKPDLLLLELGTYSYGSVILTCLEELGNTPIVLWGFREPELPGFTGLALNSLCALNMYTSFLHRLGRRDTPYLYGDPDEPAVRQQLSRVLQAAGIRAALRRARFCVVGGRVPGFYLSNVDELRFRQAVGPELVYCSLAELLAAAQQVDADVLAAEQAHVRSIVPCIEADAQTLEKTCRLTAALRAYAQKNGISAFALKCWPDFQDLYGIAVCGVVSVLNNDGLLVSCEGDIPGLTTMYMLQRLTKLPVFLTDLVNIAADGTLKLWHCGSAAPALAAPGCTACFTRHPTMTYVPGIGMDLALRPGRLVAAKLSEGEPCRLLVFSGECVPSAHPMRGNPGDIRLDGSPEALLDTIVREGIEHHYCIAYDADAGVLRELCRLCGYQLLEG